MSNLDALLQQALVLEITKFDPPVTWPAGWAGKVEAAHE